MPSVAVIRAVLVLLVLVALEIPAVVFHWELSAERKVNAGLSTKYQTELTKNGALNAQLATSQADLSASQRANLEANASIDAMQKAAADAAAEEASFRLAAAAQQATSGKIIAQRDSQISSLKAQQEGCDDAIADLRSGH